MADGGYGESLLTRDFKQTITQLSPKNGHGDISSSLSLYENRLTL